MAMLGATRLGDVNADVRSIVPGRLAWACVPQTALDKCGGVLTQFAGARLFSTDEALVYEQFFADFGPLKISMVIKYCRSVQQMLQQAKGDVIVHYCSDHPHRRVNAAILACSFAVLVLKRSAEAAYAPFVGCDPPLHPMRDAGFGVCAFQLLAIDCVRAVARASLAGHVDVRTFDVESYEKHERLEHGDCCWVVPGKFLAFSSPLAAKREIAPGKFTCSPEDYVPIFRRLGVTCIVRFNKKLYDKRLFTKAGFRFVDLFYEDGTNPTEAILQKFIEVCEAETGAMAVHCKAGLGRTGTNIGAFMMKHYSYTALETIAWLRITRPGSIIGPQHQYVVEAEHRLKRQGDAFRRHQKSGQRPAANAANAAQLRLPPRHAPTG
ncbi:dual specificity protein phosphatase-like protein CDC14A [Pelagophyceae sp. CCMP2097]|nr:dual specificity protein phosphatase-like protein CDC14A [Pelagophyceae sp. CCMP2097]|mmetsp:Transcript_30585/g.107514  ORF Transcript_30585/g.107514 Transcript_30585/m.107514 type:complete len:380 (-) Transcript_30585:76-1215(-)